MKRYLMVPVRLDALYVAGEELAVVEQARTVHDEIQVRGVLGDLRSGCAQRGLVTQVYLQECGAGVGA